MDITLGYLSQLFVFLNQNHALTSLTFLLLGILFGRYKWLFLGLRAALATVPVINTKLLQVRQSRQVASCLGKGDDVLHTSTQ